MVRVSQSMRCISLAMLLIRHNSFYVAIFKFFITILMPDIVLPFHI